MDWLVGEAMAAVSAAGQQDNTITFFTSDVSAPSGQRTYCVTGPYLYLPSIGHWRTPIKDLTQKAPPINFPADYFYLYRPLVHPH